MTTVNPKSVNNPNARNQQAPVASPFNYRSTANQVIRGISLAGQTAIVTGGYSGIGLVTAKALAQAGAHVIVPARNISKAQAALRDQSNIEINQLDLMSPQSIDAFAHEFLQNHHQLDILVCSAGIMFGPLRRDQAGNESQFSTNYLGHFRLIKRLYPALAGTNAESKTESKIPHSTDATKGHTARVVMVSSRAQMWNGVDFDDVNFTHRAYDERVAYAQSKVADVLLAVGLDKRAAKDGVQAFAVHPGMIPLTSLGRNTFKDTARQRRINGIANRLQLIRLLDGWRGLRATLRGHRGDFDYFKTNEQGAATSVWAATSPLLENKGGLYLEDCNISRPISATETTRWGVRPWSIDEANADKLWHMGEQLTGLPFGP